MIAKVILYSNKKNEIINFLSKFYNTSFDIGISQLWKKDFINPIEISEFIAAFADNINCFDIAMWISLDEDIFIRISSSNADNVIKYLFERYPY